MNDTKITKERIQNHFTYAWWKYVILVIVAVAGWNLMYTFTQYQAPPDKRLGIYFATNQVPTETLEWMQDEILQTIPDLEDVNCISILYTDDDNYYGSMQLTTYIGAGEGDIFILDKKTFDGYAPSGPFTALDEAVETGEIRTVDIDLSSGYANEENTSERKLFGIPAGELYGFFDVGVDNRDLIICVMGYSENQKAAIALVDWFIDTMYVEKPDWLSEAEAQQRGENAGDTATDIPSY